MPDITRRGFIKGAASLLPLAAVQSGVAQPASARQSAAPSERFDFVVAGAGHNSLICASYLAKAGFKVLVLEGRPTIGGGCKTQEVCLPGFKEDLCSSVHSGFQSNPAQKDLSLRDYGLEYLEPDPVVQIPFQDGTSITVWRDLNRTCETIAKFSRKDAEAFRRVTTEYKNYLAEERARNADGDAPVVPGPPTIGNAFSRYLDTMPRARFSKAAKCARLPFPVDTLVACQPAISAQVLRRFPCVFRCSTDVPSPKAAPAC